MISYLGHWFFLAVVSCLTTALLIFLSVKAFGGTHSSVIMMVRVIGVFSIVFPVMVYAFINKKANLTFILDTEYLMLISGVGIAAGVSWYSFYLALESAKVAGVDSTVVTAINYASVVVLLGLGWYFGDSQPDWRNWLGVLLVLAGIILTSIRPT